ncbi:acyltransferase family protein [Streptomyces niger]|uniref:acyltransferase family protein n=1 Tax=Streptomyces niger TaxID=66373 RepID=UPI000A8B0F0B|nr:acyltransferase [Streptomyces niger]
MTAPLNAPPGQEPGRRPSGEHPARTATETSSGRPAPLPSLTGLRFIAAVLVFFFHSSFFDPLTNPFGDRGVAEGFQWLFSKAGWMGVSFFFVLSGFVLTWSSRRDDTVVGFWRRRLLKIFPNHVAVWALAMVLFAGAATPLTAWLPNLFLVHSWFPQHGIYISVNAPSWSLCSELLFYLLFPFLIGPVRRIRTERLWAWAGAMVAGMVALEVAVDLLVPAQPRTPEGFPISSLQFWLGYNFPPGRLFEFVLGMLLARLVLAGRFPRVPLAGALALAVAGYALALNVPFLYGFTVATIVPVGVLVCAVAVADLRGERTALRGRVMQWLGEVSFGFYLAQYVVLYYGRTRILHNETYGLLGGVLELLVLLTVTLALGWLLMVCVERPAMRWARPRTRTPRAPAGRVVVSPVRVRTGAAPTPAEDGGSDPVPAA